MTQEINQQLYPVVTVESKSVFGDSYEILSFDEAIANFSKLPIVIAFLQDDEVQEMMIRSTNIGFVKTFRKHSK